jgi:hypothetical protein
MSAGSHIAAVPPTAWHRHAAPLDERSDHLDRLNLVKLAVVEVAHKVRYYGTRTHAPEMSRKCAVILLFATSSVDSEALLQDRMHNTAQRGRLPGPWAVADPMPDE